MMKRFTYCLLFIPSIFLVGAPGDLDATFGTGGITITSLGQEDYISDVTLQTDGSIVVTGAKTTNAGLKLVVARYTTVGALDTTFNTTGSQTLFVGSETQGNGIAMQVDDKIVVCGFNYDAQTNFIIARYNTDGTIDTTFNTVGYVTTSIGSGAGAYSLAIQTDGNIVAGGVSVQGSPTFTLVRYDSTGALDTSFGTGGIVTTQIGMFASMNEIVLQNDGKIIAVGYAHDGASICFVLARYNTDGSLDGTFGTGGIVTTYFGSNAQIQSVVVQSDGKIVVAGFTVDENNNNTTSFVVARYTSTGLLDTTFNSTGYNIVQIQNGSSAYGVGLQSDGKIVAAGYSIDDVPTQFAIARYTNAGILDATYGIGGIVTTTINGNQSVAQANAVAIQPDDKTVAAGFVDLDFALARYLA